MEENDPLSPQDPLAITPDFLIPEEDSSDWLIKLEPEIISDFVIRNSVQEPKIISEEPTLQIRKRRKTNPSFTDEDSNYEWKTKPSKRRKTNKLILKLTRKKNGSGKKSESDEENLVPSIKSCKKLGKRKVRRENCLKKYKEMKKVRNFKCDLCEKTFFTASHLKEHFLSHCQCLECGKVFSHSRSLQRHVAAGHDSSKKEDKELPKTTYLDISNDKSERCKKYYEQLKSERKYQCEICQKSFITNGHLNTHMYCHSEKKWRCDGCGKNFSCERSLTRHRDTFPGKHSFPCKLCDMTFFRVINLVKHMEIKHPEASIDVKLAQELNLLIESTDMNISNEDKVYVCTMCLKVFFNSETLFTHKEAMHKDNSKKKEAEEVSGLKYGDVRDSTYQCEICLKQFISLEGFEYHKKNQHKEKEVKKKKKRKGELNDEGEGKAEDSERTEFVCKICSASFALKSTLQIHLKSHNVTKNMEVKTGCHQCCICPRSFASSDGLKYHLATHTGERRYSCGQCGKKFIKKTHLSEHIATHSEIKYFKCLRCPRTFSTHSSYKKHLKHFPGPHSFPCFKCGKLFMKESMIEKHMCVDLVKITMAPEVKALLSEDMIEEYLCLAEEQAAEELAQNSEKKETKSNEDTNNSYSCYKCFKVFSNLSSLQTHQFEHIGKQNYQCRFCPETFKRADTFGAHIRNHIGSTPYMCLKCNRKFISPLTLSLHAKNYPGDHSFTCKKCQRWFPSEKRVENHECILQNSDVFICACNSAFKSWNELLEHAGTKPYKCCSCGLKYPTLIALARHIKKHTGVKPFSCEICGKSFRVKNNYLYHKKVHEQLKEIQCEHCDFKSKSQKRMDFHLFRKHYIGTNSTSTLCPICGIIFPYLSQMKKHLEVSHKNDSIFEELNNEKKSSVVLCTLCGKLLNNKYTLSNHMKKVHDPESSKQDRELKCEVCNEKFKSSKRLERHSEIHEPPRLRTCEICKEEFYYAMDLRKHMKKHDTNKPFSCQRCGKNFKVSVSLKYHSSICGNGNSRFAASKLENKVSEPVISFYSPIEPLGFNYSVVYKR